MAAMACGLAIPLAAQVGFRCPAKGGSEWHEYRSKHFVLQTDADWLKVGLLVIQLESMHSYELQAMIGEQVRIPGRLRVIAFTDPAAFAELAGDRHIGGYYKRSALGEPTIVLPILGIQAEPEAVAHEVAHHLSTFLFIRQPAWFREGIAEFVQTVADIYTGREKRHVAGSRPGSIASVLSSVPRVPFKELFEWDGGHELEGGGYHAYSWLLYHWLWTTRSEDFTAFQKRLIGGDDPGEAWRSSFPDLDPTNAAAAAKVDDALDRYKRLERYENYRIDAKVDASFDVGGNLPSADVHMLMRDATGKRTWSKEEQLENVDEALAEDESQPLAIVLRAQLDKASPLARLRKAVTIRAGDWRAWYLLAGAIGEDAKSEKEAAYRKAVALNPDSALAQNGLAWLLVKQGRAKEALPIANRALDLQPDNPAIIDTLALVAAELGKCSEALVLQRRAVSMVSPKAATAAADVHKRLADYEARCGNAVPDAASVAPTPR
jgi:tetratricopeptide (TPR) repeat protein